MKLGWYPICSASTLKMRENTEWKVPICNLDEASTPTNAPIRSFISLAALLVKVKASMFQGFTPNEIR